MSKQNDNSESDDLAISAFVGFSVIMICTFIMSQVLYWCVELFKYLITLI